MPTEQSERFDKVLTLARNIYELITTEGIDPESQEAALRIARELLELRRAVAKDS